MAKDDEDEPAIQVTTAAQVRTRRPVDEIAEARYLDALKLHGSKHAAAAAARPHLASRRSAYEVMEGHIAAKPTFAAKVRDILSQKLSLVEDEVYDRAMNGVVVERVYDEEGRLVKEKTKHDNNLLVRLARRLERSVNPRDDSWADEKRQLPPPPQVTQNIVMIDAAIADMTPEALRAFKKGLQKAKALGPGVEDVEDAEIVPSTLDNGPGSN